MSKSMYLKSVAVVVMLGGIAMAAEQQASKATHWNNPRPAIRYVAIAYMDAEPNTFWYFTGVPVRDKGELEAIKQLGFLKLPGIAGALTDCLYVWFNIDFTNEPSGEQFVVYDVNGNKLSNWVGMRSKNDWIMCMTTLGGTKYPETCKVELYYGIGKWKPVGAFSSETRGNTKVGDGFILSRIEQDQQGLAHVIYQTTSRLNEKRQYKLTAIKKDGTISVGGKGGDNLFGFAVKLEDVRQFSVESRPVWMVRCEPVALRTCEHPQYQPMQFYAQEGDLNTYSVWKRIRDLWNLDDLNTPEGAYAHLCKTRTMTALPDDGKEEFETGNIDVVKVLGSRAMVEGGVHRRTNGFKPDFSSRMDVEYAVFKFENHSWIFEKAANQEEWKEFGVARR